MKRFQRIIVMLTLLGWQIHAMEGFTSTETFQSRPDSSQAVPTRGFGRMYQEDVQQAQPQLTPEQNLAQARKNLSDTQSAARQHNNNSGSIDFSNIVSAKSNLIDAQDLHIQSQKKTLAKTDSPQAINKQLEITATEQQINQLRQKIQQIPNPTARAEIVKQFDQATTKLIRLKDELIKLQQNRIQKQSRPKNYWDSSINKVNNVIDSLKLSPQTAAKVKTPVSSIFNIVSGSKSSGNNATDLQSIKQNLQSVIDILGKNNARPVLESMQSELQNSQGQNERSQNSSTSRGSSSAALPSSSSSLFGNPLDPFVAGPGGMPMRESTVVEGQILGMAVEGAIQAAPVAAEAAVQGVELVSGALQLIGSILGAFLGGGM